ncbi:MAG: hypothetical protein RJB39_354 [Candidatus Parcubacteria bacterium]|jgi:heat shock protein HtpX
MQPQYLYKNKAANTFKTILLMGLTFAIVAALGWYLSYQFGSINYLYGALIFVVILNLISYWFSDSIALKISGAKPIDRQTDQGRQLYSTVEKLARYANLKMPQVYLIEDANMNAFATGRNENHAAVAVTTGLLQNLEQAELEGVIAHELAHIGNKDILISSIVAVLAGLIVHLTHITAFSRSDNNRGSGILGIIAIIIAPIAATLIQLAVSRSREFQADATGALITKDPEGLARALEKLHAHNHVPLATASNATAHMYISNPFGQGRGEEAPGAITKLFMTHPPVEERVAKLRGR